MLIFSKTEFPVLILLVVLLQIQEHQQKISPLKGVLPPTQDYKSLTIANPTINSAYV